MNEKKSEKLLPSLIATGVFVVLIVVMTLLKTSSSIAEWWSRSVSRVYRTGMGAVSSAFSLSLTEIAIIVAIIGGMIFLVSIISCLAKKRTSRALKLFLDLTAIVTAIIFLYSATAGMEYNRAPLPSSAYDSATASPDDLYDIAEFYQARYNELAATLPRDADGNLIEEVSFSDAADRVKASFDRLINDDYFGTPTVAKPLLATKEIFAHFGISGIYLSLTSEANVNSANTHYSQIPVTIAHEMAHSAGVMREYEANILAFYVCLYSGDPYLEYSAMDYGFSHLSSAVRETFGYESDKYQSLRMGYSEYIYKDYAAQLELHKKYGYLTGSFLRSIGNFFNDLYLKISGLIEGTGSYDVDQGTFDTVIVPDQDGKPVVEVKEITYGDIQKIFIDKYFSSQSTQM